MSLKSFVVLSFALTFSWIALPLNRAIAEIVLSTFEESQLASKLVGGVYRGDTGPGDVAVPSTFRSGAVSLINNGLEIQHFGNFDFPFWSGVGISSRTALQGSPELYEQGNDLISKPASGAGGSQTWAVAFESGILTADNGYQFASVDLANTLYTYETIRVGNFVAQPFSTANNDFFTVRFTNPDTAATKDFDLANFRNGNSSILDSWQNFDLSSLQASRLSISFLGSQSNQIGLTTPTYVALDNIAVAAVPEPSSFALLLAAGTAVAWRRRHIAKRGSNGAES